MKWLISLIPKAAFRVPLCSALLRDATPHLWAMVAKVAQRFPRQPLRTVCRPCWSGAATSRAACGGGKPALMFCLGAWTRALACAPWMTLHCSVLVTTHRPFHFSEGNGDPPSYTWHQRQCANNCPDSEHVGLWMPCLYKPRGCAGMNQLVKAISYAWRPLQCPFAVPGGRSEENIKWTATSHWQSQMHLRKKTGQDFDQKGKQEGKATILTDI